MFLPCQAGREVNPFQKFSTVTCLEGTAALLADHEEQEEEHDADQEEHGDGRHDGDLLPLVVLDALQGQALLLGLEEAGQGEALHLQGMVFFKTTLGKPFSIDVRDLHAEDLVEFVLCEVVWVDQGEEAGPGQASLVDLPLTGSSAVHPSSLCFSASHLLAKGKFKDQVLIV